MDNKRGSMAKVALAVALTAAVLVGCRKPEEFPVEPHITFKSFEQFGDSASLTISFTDGDGDIGLDASDTQSPFDAPPWNSNLFLEYYELQNGEWVQPTLLLPFHYRIPRLTPTGRNKALQGDISVALKPWPIPGTPYDTVRFSVMLVDRTLHQSNIVFSEDIKTQ